MVSTMTDTKNQNAVKEWLLDGDPTIRWQALRDLTDQAGEAIASARRQMESAGWAAALLARQNEDGTWGTDEGEVFWRWNATLHTLLLLQDFGLDPNSEAATKAIKLLDEHFDWGPHWGSPRFFEGEVEPCINGGVLELGAYFGHPNAALLERLLSEQLSDGGWNCEQENGSVRASFHTTICVMEGLLEYERAVGADTAITEARQRAEEYLLERRLFHSLSSGKVIDLRQSNVEKPVRATQFSFPTTWHYDVLRGLEYFRRADVRDERLADAIQLVIDKRGSDGRWALENPHRDSVGLIMEKAGEASRWITLRALRVLNWYSG